ncbi:oxaloacetate decarboxylase [Roseibium sp. RKSG952]|uniref:isocitrate lyase/PEP mutase family protein n=1 Tax=Roseibium sp. RKSG952 TaxID=2529384 RepID=UPI0012BC74D0|nr:isocitrate lyase/phosphoenolpyruvate mutase family protein [Roseibium sp. RKSG952]MTH98847.1 isocitrate lyase/phosphoenolpyruvate mutase family protein [Roseibium sp. RKSG952]
METIEKRRDRFKALHSDRRAFLMPNPFDIGSTRILEGLGFEAVATTSAGHAFTLGCKDVEGWITRDLALAHAQEIIGATTLPVNGDLENGFGDAPEDVAETIKGAIEVGLAGCSIEDYTGDPKQPFYDRELAVERIKAAVDVKNRLAPNFVLTARSEAPIQSGHELEEAATRLKAYHAAGADCIYAPDLAEKDQIETIVRAIDAPLNILASRRKFHMTRKELADIGVARVSIGAGLARIAYGAFMAAAEDIKGGGSFGCFDRASRYTAFDAFLKTRI